jgi:hypothetical protein
MVQMPAAPRLAARALTAVLDRAPSGGAGRRGLRPRSGGLLDEAAITRLAGALPLERNDERAVRRARHMTRESIAYSGDAAADGLPDMTG